MFSVKYITCPNQEKQPTTVNITLTNAPFFPHTLPIIEILIIWQLHKLQSLFISTSRRHSLDRVILHIHHKIYNVFLPITQPSWENMMELKCLPLGEQEETPCLYLSLSGEQRRERTSQVFSFLLSAWQLRCIEGGGGGGGGRGGSILCSPHVCYNFNVTIYNNKSNDAAMPSNLGGRAAWRKTTFKKEPSISSGSKRARFCTTRGNTCVNLHTLYTHTHTHTGRSLTLASHILHSQKKKKNQGWL